MRAAVFHGPGNVRMETVADPELELDSDVIVRVEQAGVCGADLWAYRGYGGIVGGPYRARVRRHGQEIGADVRPCASATRYWRRPDGPTARVITAEPG